MVPLHDRGDHAASKKTATGPDPVDIQVGMQNPRRHALKAKSQRIQFVDKDFDRPRGVVVRRIVIKTTGKQSRLAAIFTLDEAGHPNPQRYSIRSLGCFELLHSHGPERPNACADVLSWETAPLGTDGPAGLIVLHHDTNRALDTRRNDAAETPGFPACGEHGSHLSARMPRLAVSWTSSGACAASSIPYQR